MTLEAIRAALGWCAVINFALLLWWFGWLALAHDLVYRVHTRWFRVSEERFDAIHYAAMAAFKLSIVVLNVVPYLALRIVG